MNNLFEDFPVYKKSLEIIEGIDLVCKTINTKEFYFLKDQIRRASSSIVLNIAEGSGKWTKKDKCNYYRISRASVFECMGALDLLKAYQLLDNQKIIELKTKLNEVAGDLQALIYSIEKRIK
jgi:four helix bundle protein